MPLRGGGPPTVDLPEGGGVNRSFDRQMRREIDDMDQPNLEGIARAVIDANLYMILGTVGEDGQPWVTPVYYSAEGYTHFYWVSSPESRHSRNISVRPQVSIVIFNSGTPIGTAGSPVGEGDGSTTQAVYMSGVAGEITGTEVERGVGAFSRGARARGAGEWTPENVRPPSHLRLYRATAAQQSILCPVNYPEPCSVHGRTDDHRVEVQLAQTG